MSDPKVRTNINDVYEVLEQQKKLEEMKGLILNCLEKVNQTINAITVS